MWGKLPQATPPLELRTKNMLKIDVLSTKPGFRVPSDFHDCFVPDRLICIELRIVMTRQIQIQRVVPERTAPITERWAGSPAELTHLASFNVSIPTNHTKAKQQRCIDAINASCLCI